MRIALLAVTASILLVACQKQAEAPAADANAATADANAPAATPAGLVLTETSWEFTDPKTKKLMLESVDANGNYIAQSGTEHIDHGTAAVKGGKACFTSAMDKEGEVCWTDPKLEVGQSGTSTSDKGETLTLKRVEYKPLSM